MNTEVSIERISHFSSDFTGVFVIVEFKDPSISQEQKKNARFIETLVFTMRSSQNLESKLPKVA